MLYEVRRGREEEENEVGKWRKEARRRKERKLTHRNEGLAPVQGLDHPDLGVRSATSDDEREDRKSVDFVVGELVESEGGGEGQYGRPLRSHA